MKKKILILVTILLCFTYFLTINNNATIYDDIPITDYTNESAYNVSYYDSVVGMKGDNLLNGLALISQEKHRYFNSYGELRGGNCYSDVDPSDPDNKLIDFYMGIGIDNSWIQSGDNYSILHWNREHVWCQSLSGGLYGDSGAGSDIHHLRPEIICINSSRNNSLYGDVDNSNAKYYNSTLGVKATESNGTLYGYLDSSIDPTDATDQVEGVFEPTDTVKGDVARILMYMYMHYSKEVSANADYSYALPESGDGLVITNIVYTSDKTSDAAWDLLLSWNELDPVDDLEQTRNTYATSVTGVRNPFIDHPEFATMIWDKTYNGDGAINDDSITSNPDTPVIDSRLNELITTYHNDGVYTKKSNIYLSSASQAEIAKYFHGNVEKDRTTYYNGEYLLMGDIDGTFNTINSGYRTAGADMKHFTYKDGKVVDDYTVKNTTLHEFYVTLNKLKDSNYFDSTWVDGSHTVTGKDDKYLADFLAFTAPCLYDTVFENNYITSQGIILTIKEGSHEIYGDYLSLSITLTSTDSGKLIKGLILSEARIYKGNSLFNENVMEVEANYAHSFASSNELADSNYANTGDSGSTRNLTLTDWSWTYTPTWKTGSGHLGYDSTKGVQIGSGSNPATTIEFATTTSDKIQTVTVNASTANSAVATLSLYINDTLIETKDLSNTATDYTFNVDNLSGELKLVYNQTETSKALYIKKIDITYLTIVEIPSEPTLETYNVTIDSNVTNGTITLDKNNVNSGETVTLTVTPNDGYQVDKVYVDGNEVTLTNNSYSFTVNKNITVSATFKEISVVKEEQTIIIDFTDTSYVSSNGWQQGDTITTLPTTDSNLSITTTNGGTPTRYWSSDLRVYKNGGSIIVTVPAGYTIKSIQFGGSAIESLTYNGTAISTNSIEINNTTATFTATATVKITKVTIIYE